MRKRSMGSKYRRRLTSCLSAPLFALLILAGALYGQEVEIQVYGLMMDGIEAYDNGDFETAIARYSEALALTPQNTLILYERAMAYLSSGDYDQCIRDAESGLGRGSTNEPGLFAMLGNCQSERGDAVLAIDTYNEGLARFPENVQLNFNLAVALARGGESALARTHLRATLDLVPDYTSANLLLGQLYQADGYRVPAIYQYLRFLSTELETPRAGAIARTTLNLINERAARTGEDPELSGGDTTSGRPPNASGSGDDDFSGIEKMLTMMEAPADGPAASPGRTPAAEAVAAIQNAVAITRRAADLAPRDSWVWAHAVSFVLALEERGHLEAMSYIAFSELEGGRDWIDENSGAVERFLIWREQALRTP